MVLVLYKILKGKTISQTLQLDIKNQIHNLISLFSKYFSQLFCKIQSNDKIMLAIDAFFLLYY